MTDTLSQAEIDAMMNGSFDESTPAPVDEAHIPEAPKPIIDTTDESTRFDLLGEVGNISMSQAATILSSILNRRVNITTPRVKKCRFSEIMGELETPKVATIVEFKEGLLGSNLMVLDVNDANIIADLMMGGEGKPSSTEFTDLQLSAVAEAMNQMIGSASTSMSTMIERKVDILPPHVRMWNSPESIDYDTIEPDEYVYRISFDLTVEGLIESEIMQIFSNEVVEEIEKSMLGISEESPLANMVSMENVEPTPAAEPTPHQPQAQVQQPQVVAAAQPMQQQATTQVSQPQFQPLADSTVKTGDNLDLILDVPLNLSVVLGRSQKKIRDILSLNVGSVVELDNLTDEPLDILLNGKLIAQGEVVVINENFGIRITNILSMSQRLQSINN
ncbi:flagellar motor switch phosphatase FliY [Periweissella fabalis]|uniref:Flagellar motor switch phosphatase FliY n=1 Tax=Periweissella fabalis TaxID=1070421 RepID=A0A7X6N2A6_9LACO|nr:flagellar motor switch phosphatase FliY [Periweissella fabalis]MCM0599953.1 flagellar motor switch phosphatase FliY [Periweissella fabalis]NKZ23992.1 flagellar motor switch phosphatase FliY [Periweissella fabalis]